MLSNILFINKRMLIYITIFKQVQRIVFVILKNNMKKKKKSKVGIFKKIKNFFKNKNNQRIFGFIFLLFSIYCFVAFTSSLSTWKEDFSYVKDMSLIDSFNKESEIEIKNSLGKIGAILSYNIVYLGTGITSFLAPILFLILGIRLFGYKIISINIFIKKSIWILIWAPIFIAHIFYEKEWVNLYAGNTGIYTENYLENVIGNIGTSLLLITTFLIYITSKFNITNNKINSFIEKLKPKKKHNTIKEKNIQLSNEEQVETQKNTINETPHNKTELDININSNLNTTNTIENDKEKISTNKNNYDPKLDLSSYKLPKIDLLNDYGSGEIKIDKKELEENKQKIVDTLGNYNIGITSITATIGPTITLYEIVPEAGVRISKIKNLEDDIALSLSAEGIRIIAPIPGRGTIGIEVPNQNPTIVSMITVLKSKKFQESNMDLPIAFGKTISNETFIIDLAKMPHLLMAGATGQGKSVGLNAVLTSLLYKKHPSEIKFVLIDPKKVELTLFNKIERHFLAKLPDTDEAIITDTKKVVNTVNSLCIEMDQRYELLKNAMCRNLKEYNKKFIERKLNPDEGHRYLPYIVLVIDEFADLIMTAGKEIETPIARLAQLARAIGIHLIIATQRPSVNVITGLIKANFPARVAFRVTSRIDSRTILDTGGADQLIGKGDMLISTGSELIRLQCAFIDTPEVDKICDFIGSQRAYPEAYLLPEYIGDQDSQSIETNLEDRDTLFDDAARLVVKYQSGSTSAIQRRMKIGYNRAGRIIDELEAAGIVGPFEGSKARQVLIKNDVELEEVLNKLNT